MSAVAQRFTELPNVLMAAFLPTISACQAVLISKNFDKGGSRYNHAHIVGGPHCNHTHIFKDADIITHFITDIV